MKPRIYDKILGSLLGAAAGDAMGAATETMSYEQIRERYEGGVSDFCTPSSQAVAYGNIAGQITDDFSQIYCLVKHMSAHNGSAERSVIEDAMLEWASIPAYADRFMGPTTRLAVDQIKENRGLITRVAPRHITYGAQATNGCAMKIAPAALFHPNDIEAAIRTAMDITRVTHDNQIAHSAACAVAAAIAYAFNENADIYSIVQAAYNGAAKGETWGYQNSHIASGPSVSRRMDLAISIACSSGSREERLKKLYDIVGTGLPAAEAVPAAFGIFVIVAGDPQEAILAAANIGYDTDTIATIVGSIAGAWKGYQAFPHDYLKLLNTVNSFSLEQLAMDIVHVIE